MKRPKIICITGLDGSGKSTIIKGLCRSLPGSLHSHIWKLLDNSKDLLFKNKADIDKYLCTLTPNARLQFLSHALSYAIDSDLNTRNSILFLNAYYYKYFAMEMALGCDITLVSDIIKSFPVPDQTFFLDVSVELASERKTTLSRYECRLAEVPDKESFINFQKKCLTHWEVFDNQSWHTIDATRTPETIVNDILDQLEL